MRLNEAVRRVRRMWDEVDNERLPPHVISAMAEKLANEHMPTPDPAHKASVLAAMRVAALERDHVLEAGDRSFRAALDQGSEHVGTWRLLDTIRPQLALLPWPFWVIAAVLVVFGAFVFPFVTDWGPAALTVTVPLIGLVGLIYTLRASSSGMSEWEASCPVTPFQLALARLVIVLTCSIVASLLGSLILMQYDFGISLAGLTVSWFAPLLFVVGLYLAADVWFGGMAGSAAAAAAWFGYVLLTRGGLTANSLALSVDGFTLAPLDSAALIAGLLLLGFGLASSSHTGRKLHEHRAP